MFPPYIDRLIVVREMLDSPQKATVREGYDLLFNLWSSYSDNADFDEEMRDLTDKHLALVQELTNRLNESLLPDEEKAILLKQIVLLYPSPIALNEQAVKVVASKNIKAGAPKKIFISYSHRDETFKNELIVMLAGLQRQGIIDLWQDRRIQAGSNWFNAIQKAMEVCDVAMLLVSSDFIASRFIEEVEIKGLFKRRVREGLCVIPIIVRPCLWESEPIIKDIQTLPRDGKPVISFSKENGDRDQVWADIGKAMENIVKGL